MKCPSCEHENVAGTTFCELCGEELESDISPSEAAADAAGGVASSTPLEDSGEIVCPACENKNPADNIACEVCGTELNSGSAQGTDEEDEADTGAEADADVDAEPAPVPAPLADTDVAADEVQEEDADVDTQEGEAAPAQSTSGGAPLSPGKVKLVVEQGMIVGKQFVLGDQESQVGREDEEEEIYPDIDLSDQDEGYVHRQHATLTFENDALFVTHLGGANRSRLNNKPIPDNEPQPVKLGDKLAFGKVVLRVLPA